MSQEPEERDTAVGTITLEIVDKVMTSIDDTCRTHNLDASAMIYMSVHIASHLIARGLFFANGPEARQTLKAQMLDNVNEIVDSAIKHIDSSELELQQSGIRLN